MSNVTNLNRFRKKKTRADNEKSAEENRAKFGRTKAEKKIAKDELHKQESDLDGKRRDDS